jgi:uncharacterized protein (UPF0303 family)
LAPRLRLPNGVGTGQPYPSPLRATIQLLLFVVASVVIAACGSTSVTNVAGPGAVRCTASISSSSSVVPADGGTVALSVSAARDCTWSAQSEASWLKLGTTSGQGAATINVTAAANSDSAARTGSVTINDQRIDLTQDGRGCTITLATPGGTTPASGGRSTLTISTLAGCPWTIVSSAPWVVPTQTSGSGSASVAFDVQANSDVAREASLTVGTASVVVSQAAAVTAPACSFALDASTRDFAATGGSGAIAVTSQTGCNWSVSGGASWITLPVTSGSGSGTVPYTVAANTSPIARQAALTVAGRVYTVTQQGISCAVTLTPPSQNFAAAGGSGTIQVTIQAGCTWTATSNAGWAILRAPGGTGPGQIAYDVQPNTDAAARTATITIGGQTHTVTQQGGACGVTITPPSSTFAAAGGNGSVQVTAAASCAWTVTSDSSWVTPAITSSSGSKTVAYTVAANPDTVARTATLTIGGQTHTITQSAAAPVCTFDLTPLTRNFAAAGGSSTVHVATGSTCAWTAVSSVPWITIPMQNASGTGTADVPYTVVANTTTAARSGTITIGGQSHTVTQDAAQPVCTYALSPAERTFGQAGGTGTVTVTTGTGCPWTAISSNGFVVVQTPSGTGSGTITYQVMSDGPNVDRTATITVNGQVHTVRQKAN